MTPPSVVCVGGPPRCVMKLPFILPFFIILPLGPGPEALALFRKWCRSPSPELRIQAVRTLRGHNGRESRAALLSLLSDPHPAVRRAVRAELKERPSGEGPDLTRAIARLKSPRARREGLRALLARKEDPTPFAADRDPDVRARALASGRVALPEVRAALKNRDGRTRALALECLREPALARERLRDPADEVRIACTRVVDDPASLARLLADRSWRVRLAAIRGAERLRHRDVVPALIRRLGGPPGRERARAAAALEHLTQVSYGEDQRRWQRWWSHAGDGFRLPAPRPRPRREYTKAVVTFRRLPVFSRRLAFVLDASRSMAQPAPGGRGRSRWDLLLNDLREVLARLPSAARFNVFLFRTEVEAWRKRLVPATPGARRACRAWIEGAEPGGWTNLFDALALALADDEVDTLYVLTDGVPSRGRERERRAILDEVAFLNRYKLTQINCVQAGSEQGLGKKWRGFLDELAKAHDGVSVRE
ncbi:MAG: HEAT repeat domain-containing protein [Planctomycetota bacterium]